jgi:hypothetical protein
MTRGVVPRPLPRDHPDELRAVLDDVAEDDLVDEEDGREDLLDRVPVDVDDDVARPAGLLVRALDPARLDRLGIDATNSSTARSSFGRSTPETETIWTPPIEAIRSFSFPISSCDPAWATMMMSKSPRTASQRCTPSIRWSSLKMSMLLAGSLIRIVR